MLGMSHDKAIYMHADYYLSITATEVDKMFYKIYFVLENVSQQ